MKNKWVKIGSMILLSLIMFQSCGKKDNDVIKIGAILPLTGRAAFLGEGYKRAMNIGIGYLANKNNRVEIYFEDSQGKSSIGTSAANKLINIEKCNILIVANGNVVEATFPVAQKNNIPVIALTSTPNITNKGELLFRVWLNEFDQIKSIANYIRAANFKRVGLYYVNTDYGLAVNKVANDYFKDILVYNDAYSSDQLDFKNQALEIKAANLDALYILGNPNEYIPIIRQIKEQGINAQIFGTSAISLNFVKDNLGELINGTVFSGPKSLIKKTTSKEYAFFSKKYFDITGNEPEWFYSFCFDQILFIGETRSNDLAAELKQINSFKGANGIIQMNNSGDSEVEIYLFKYVDQKIVKLTTY